MSDMELDTEYVYQDIISGRWTSRMLSRVEAYETVGASLHIGDDAVVRYRVLLPDGSPRVLLAVFFRGQLKGVFVLEDYDRLRRPENIIGI
jgi:hypothetical protein